MDIVMAFPGTRHGGQRLARTRHRTWTMLLLLAASCGPPRPADTPQSGDATTIADTTGASGERGVSVCLLVTSVEASGIAGRPVVAADSTGTECKYAFGNDAHLQVGWTPDAGAAGYAMFLKGAEQAAARGSDPPVPLSDLGSEAFFQRTANGLVQTIMVRRGDGVLVIGSRGEFGSRKNLMEPLRAAAVEALARL